MATLTLHAINSTLTLWNIRGQQLSAQIQTVLSLTQSSPVDVSAIAAAVVLLGQAYATVQLTVADIIMQDPMFASVSLDEKSSILQGAVAWKEMSVLLGTIAFANGYPVLDSIIQPPPSAHVFGTQLPNTAAVVASLETYLSVPTLAGITSSVFWLFDVQSVLNLGTLASIDWTLNTTPSTFGFIDTLNIVTTNVALLQKMIPVADVNVTALLQQIAAAVSTGFQNAQVTAVKQVTVPRNTDLESLALQYTGDATQWQQIAIYNNLVYPYITDDLIAALGKPLSSTVLLQTTVTQGANVLYIGDYRGMEQNQPLLIQEGATYEIVNVLSVTGPISIGDPAIDTLVSTWPFFTFSGRVVIDRPLANTYTATNTIVKVFQTESDGGKILTAGDKLLIPVSSAAVATGVLTQTEDDPQILGTDIGIDVRGYMSLSGGDLASVTGADNLNQALRNRLKTPKHSLKLHPTYGNNLQLYVGLANKPYYNYLARVDAVQTVLADPRVDSVPNSAVTANGGVATIDLKVELKSGKQFSPSRVLVSIRNK